ncbi:hypothetical protein B0H17DRAFT_1203097 [Mycena rosella]|uniref:Uncharacterized protein n=1 Tax=Mycena rosella TaxID=1033263 RepID=A0AAD7DCA0_MYCRO|nr:hypothetical protein B0H17DRAFT_1203097 [Mycena rosella]
MPRGSVAKGKGKATREDEEEDEEEKAAARKSDRDARRADAATRAQTATSNMRFSAEELQIINEALEEIRAIDQEAAEEEFEEMEVRHGVLPSLDPRESDEVNDETDSNKEFAGKQKRQDLHHLKVDKVQVLGLYLSNKRKENKTRKSEVGSRKSPKAKMYRRRRKERLPEDNLCETQRHLDSAFEQMLRREGEREVRMAALELTLHAILDRMREQFPMPAERPLWLHAALKKAEFFEFGARS